MLFVPGLGYVSKNGFIPGGGYIQVPAAVAALDGAATATATADGALSRGISLESAATAVADAYGDLDAHISTALSGQAAASISAVADLTDQSDLSASAVAQALAAADLIIDDLFSDRLIEKYTLRPSGRNYAITAPARNYTLQAVV